MSADDPLAPQSQREAADALGLHYWTDDDGTVHVPTEPRLHQEIAHDDQCEAEFINPPGAWLPCRCRERLEGSDDDDF